MVSGRKNPSSRESNATKTAKRMKALCNGTEKAEQKKDKISTFGCHAQRHQKLLSFFVDVSFFVFFSFFVLVISMMSKGPSHNFAAGLQNKKIRWEGGGGQGVQCSLSLQVAANDCWVHGVRFSCICVLSYMLCTHKLPMEKFGGR